MDLNKQQFKNNTEEISNSSISNKEQNLIKQMVEFGISILS